MLRKPLLALATPSSTGSVRRRLTKARELKKRKKKRSYSEFRVNLKRGAITIGGEICDWTTRKNQNKWMKQWYDLNDDMINALDQHFDPGKTVMKEPILPFLTRGLSIFNQLETCFGVTFIPRQQQNYNLHISDENPNRLLLDVTLFPLYLESAERPPLRITLPIGITLTHHLDFEKGFIYDGYQYITDETLSDKDQAALLSTLDPKQTFEKRTSLPSPILDQFPSAFFLRKIREITQFESYWKKALHFSFLNAIDCLRRRLEDPDFNTKPLPDQLKSIQELAEQKLESEFYTPTPMERQFLTHIISGKIKKLDKFQEKITQELETYSESIMAIIHHIAAEENSAVFEEESDLAEDLRELIATEEFQRKTLAGQLDLVIENAHNGLLSDYSFSEYFLIEEIKNLRDKPITVEKFKENVLLEPYRRFFYKLALEVLEAKDYWKKYGDEKTKANFRKIKEEIFDLKHCLQPGDELLKILCKEIKTIMEESKPTSKQERKLYEIILTTDKSLDKCSLSTTYTSPLDLMDSALDWLKSNFKEVFATVKDEIKHHGPLHR